MKSSKSALPAAVASEEFAPLAAEYGLMVREKTVECFREASVVSHAFCQQNRIRS